MTEMTFLALSTVYARAREQIKNMSHTVDNGQTVISVILSRTGTLASTARAAR